MYDLTKLHDNRNLLFEMIPGIVEDHKDPKKLGRIRVKLEGRDDVISSWVRPLFNGLGLESGIWAIPRKSDYVVCFFMHGKPEIGFWIGGFIDTDTKQSPKTESDQNPKKVDFTENERHPSGGNVEDNYIIKHPSGHKIIFYDNQDTLFENKHITRWYYETGEIDETSNTPDSSGTFRAKENGEDKGYQRNVKPDGTITELNPHCKHVRDKDGNTKWETDGSDESIIQKFLKETVRGMVEEIYENEYSQKVSENVSLDHSKDVTWKIGGSLNIEVGQDINISAGNSYKVTAKTIQQSGSISSTYKDGLIVTISSQLTAIN